MNQFAEFEVWAWLDGEGFVVPPAGSKRPARYREASPWAMAAAVAGTAVTMFAATFSATAVGQDVVDVDVGRVAEAPVLPGERIELSDAELLQAGLDHLGVPIEGRSAFVTGLADKIRSWRARRETSAA